MATSLHIDKTIKDKVSVRAKQDQLSFSAVVRILLRDYAEGNIQIGARITHPTIEVEEIKVDNTTQKKMDTLMRTWKTRSTSAHPEK